MADKNLTVWEIIGVLILGGVIVGIITHSLTANRCETVMAAAERECETVRAADIATMLENDAQWRRDTVVAGCAVWATQEGGAVEWQWANGSIEE